MLYMLKVANIVRVEKITLFHIFKWRNIKHILSQINLIWIYVVGRFLMEHLTVRLIQRHQVQSKSLYFNEILRRKTQRFIDWMKC